MTQSDSLSLKYQDIQDQIKYFFKGTHLCSHLGLSQIRLN